MFTISKSIAAVVASVSLFAAFAMAAPAARADDKDIAQALRAGGLVLVVRHGATFPDQADTDPLNFDNIAAQRNLNDKGKALAKAFGDALRQAGVPIGKVYTSKYNRAYETAVIAGFPDIEKTTDLTEGGLIVSPNENNRRADAFRKMLAVAPKDHYQHDPHHPPAQYRRRARQGLVRRQGRRDLDLPSRRWRLQARCPHSDGRVAAHCDRRVEVRR